MADTLYAFEALVSCDGRDAQLMQHAWCASAATTFYAFNMQPSCGLIGSWPRAHKWPES